MKRQEDQNYPVSKGINFWSAFKLPGVMAYSLCYFCLKFSSYGLMLWLPMYLQKSHHYSDYETAACVSMLDIGYVFGGVAIGYLTDLLYCRRSPVAVASIIFATLLHILLMVVNPGLKPLFFFYVFLIGLLMGGAVAISSGISCTDIVSLFSHMKRVNSRVYKAMRKLLQL